jgi:CHAD domain-containing protein
MSGGSIWPRRLRHPSRLFYLQMSMGMRKKSSEQEFHSPVERLLASIAGLQQQPTPKGTHFYRTSLRRFQAWSDVVHPQVGPEQKEALQYLDKLRKATGKLRDSEVHLGISKDLKGVDAKEKKKLTAELKSRRKRYEKKLTARLDDPIVASLWRTLWLFREQPTGGPEAASVNSTEAMTTLALREFRDFVQHRPKLSPESLHQYRLQAKQFRYTAELAGETAAAKDLVETWKRVQDVIGEWHDYLTLSEVAADVLGSSTVHSTLVNQTNQTYADSELTVKEAERKLLSRGADAARKSPQRARSAERASRVA